MIPVMIADIFVPTIGLIIVFMLLTAAARFGLNLLARLGLGEPSFKGRIKKRKLMTEAEFRLYRMLKQVLPGKDIMAQTSMDALMLPEESTYKKRQSIRGRYSQKRVDFLVVNPQTGDVELIIELDDRTHNKEKDRIRDAMTAAAGYRTLRISYPLPDRAKLAALVNAELGYIPTHQSAMAR